jgi:hypothetical protein
LKTFIPFHFCFLLFFSSFPLTLFAQSPGDCILIPDIHFNSSSQISVHVTDIYSDDGSSHSAFFPENLPGNLALCPDQSATFVAFILSISIYSPFPPPFSSTSFTLLLLLLPFLVNPYKTPPLSLLTSFNPSFSPLFLTPLFQDNFLILSAGLSSLQMPGLSIFSPILMENRMAISLFSMPFLPPIPLFSALLLFLLAVAPLIVPLLLMPSLLILLLP